MLSVSGTTRHVDAVRLPIDAASDPTIVAKSSGTGISVPTNVTCCPSSRMRAPAGYGMYATMVAPVGDAIDET